MIGLSIIFQFNLFFIFRYISLLKNKHAVSVKNFVKSDEKLKIQKRLQNEINSKKIYENG